MRFLQLVFSSNTGIECYKFPFKCYLAVPHILMVTFLLVFGLNFFWPKDYLELYTLILKHLYFFMLFISNLIKLWPKKLLFMVSVFSVFWNRFYTIIKYSKILHGLEWKVYFIFLGSLWIHKHLYIFIKWNWLLKFYILHHYFQLYILSGAKREKIHH